MFKRILFRTIAIIFTVGIILLSLEVFLNVYYFAQNQSLRVENKSGNVGNSYLKNLLPPNTNYADMLFPHPYLGYVHNPYYFDSRSIINRVGLLGHDYPLEKDPETFTILFTGGSVASQFAGFRGELNVLEKKLNKYYTMGPYKKFIVLNGAAGAWHQPQQFILTSLYADSIDAVISLDGFNEHYLIEGGSQFELPAENFLVSMGNYFRKWDYIWPLWLEGKLIKLNNKCSFLQRSKLAGFVISNLRNKLREIYIRKDQRNTTLRSAREVLSSLFAYPSDWTPERKREKALRSYKKYILLMHAVAEQMGLKELYLIQPVPAIQKRLSKKEMETVGGLSYKDSYRQMAESLLELRNREIPIYSLESVFHDNLETIYLDAIHVSFKGNQIILRKILELLELEWGLKRNED